MLTDLEIAQKTKIKRIVDVAKEINLTEDDIETYGKYKAKINLSVKRNKKGHVILVTAITPTPAGEGKSTTTVGLADSLRALGKKAIVALREPSLGPVMGVKGGAAGGGYAQALPMEDLNLHFTGDIHAVTTANNLVSAMIDNHIHKGNDLDFDIENIVWHRCLDMNDRALRQVTIALGKGNGKERKECFDISVASEMMAVFTLAKDIEDLRVRLNRIIIAYNTKGEPINLESLGCVGAVILVLHQALAPNLIQTIEGTPVIVHGGPFANIAHGCNSIIATNMARELADYVVTEAGFGADLGAEKFLNIKARTAKIKPSAVVIVATIRALKMHGGVAKTNLQESNVEALIRGIANLAKHIENIKKFKLPYVVAINKFSSDTDDEVGALLRWCEDNNHTVSLSDVWAKGSKGGLDLARKVLEKTKEENSFAFLYELNETIEEKITKITKEIYGAKDVLFSPKALMQIAYFNKQGWDNLPICMAKTQYSLSDDPKKLGRPKGFTINIRELKASIGAGFIVCLTGNIMTMPGLPKHPAALDMDVVDGMARGLF